MVGACLLFAVRSPSAAPDVFAVTGEACPRNTNVIPTGALVTVAFSVFGRDRRHFVTCNRLARIAVRLRGSRPSSQLYVGKRPTSEGIGRVIRRFVVMAFCSPFSGNAASR